MFAALALAAAVAAPASAAVEKPAPDAPIAGEIPVTSSVPEAAQAFREGRRRAINWDCPSATTLLRRALELEPHFPLAMAWLGFCLSTPEGAALTDQALGLSAPLPPTERLSIETLAAQKHGDDEQVRKLRRKLVDLAPNDALAQFQYGVLSQYDHKSQAAILHLRRAVELNPKLAEAYNYLGYVYAQQGMAEDGIAAARKFVELEPGEANAHDSLGEVLMLLGHLDEAAAELEKAAQLDPTFWMAYAGLAYVHFYQGNFSAARAALAAGAKAPHGELESRALQLVAAWGALGEGRDDDALAMIDDLEKDAQSRKSALGVAWARLERGELQLERSKLAECHAQIAASRTSLAEAGSGEQQNRVRRALLVLDARLAAAEEKPLVAETAASALAGELRRAPSNMDVRSAQHLAQGEAALAARDPAAAVAPLALCPDAEVVCRLELARAQLAAGDARAAEATRARMLGLYFRDNLHRGEDPAALYVRLKMTRK